MDLKQKKKNRFLFLEKIYKDGKGSSNAVFSMWDIGRDLSITEDETSEIVDYLINENLLEPYGLGGTIHLSHWGIKEVEEAIEHPDKETEHFLPINIISIGTMTNSTLQQGTSHSSIAFGGQQLIDLEDIIKSIKAISESLDISLELHKELYSELQTLEIQKESPKPKSIIIKESLKTIRSLMESVIGNAITPSIIGQINQFINGL